MKQFKNYGVVLWACICLVLASCGDSETSTISETDSMDIRKADPVPVTTSIISSPQNIVVVRYKVSDYSKWRSQYDTRDSMRMANGIHNYLLGRGLKDSNDIIVVVKADDMQKAKAFSKDASLGSAMKKGFVTGSPRYTFTNVVYQDTSKNMSDIRAINFFTVKDWDAWVRSFGESRQVRIDNGVIERSYGHDVDDNHKVVLVIAINDSSRAESFLRSDTLRTLRLKSGLTGEVEKFVFRVVHRY